ncbi:unnamed protein product [Rotaria sp. Silwood1]|nr:unnamed protein product [Rotaria sp. Silwood1]
MSIDLHIRIEIVLMMARLESPSSVRRHFHRENMSDIPSEKTIKAIYDKFIETGSVHDRERSGRPSLMTTEKLDEIEEILSDNAMVSVRRVSQEVNLSKSTVHLAMRNVLGYKPYKMHLTQQLDDEDKDVRVVMAEALLPILDHENNDGLIFFSDEATFHISGMVHKHNCRIWARDNPHVTMEVSMNSPKVTSVSRALIANPKQEGIQLLFRHVHHEKAVGFGILSWSRLTLKSGRLAIMKDFYVDQSYRGQGIADLLIGECARYAREHGGLCLT